MESRRVKENNREKGEGGPNEGGPTKKIIVVKVIRLKPGPRLRGTSEIELALVKPIGVSKKFCFSNMPSSTQGWHDKGGHVVQAVGEPVARVIKFTSLDDSSSDVRELSPPGKTIAMDVPNASNGYTWLVFLLELLRLFVL
jgi:hypothetical protein